MSTQDYRASTVIWTVFRRELRENLLKKSSLITLIIMAIASVGAIFVVNFAINKADGEAVTVAVVGEAPFARAAADLTDQLGDSADTAATTAFGTESPKLELTVAADADAARTAVDDGSADAALIPDTAPGKGGSWKLLDDDPPAWLAGLLQESLQQQTETAILKHHGVDPTEFFAQSQGATVTVESISAERDEKIPTTVFTLISVMVMMTAILVFGGAIASSVIEEKSSRVIEIILATVHPLHLLAGKILGAAAAGLILLTVLVGSSAAALVATGLNLTLDIPLTSVLLMIPCFILGYLFFASLYAAAASLVSRMEDFQGAQMPVLVVSMITMYVPLFGWNNLDATWVQIAAWIPPVSVTTAPMQYAVGNFSALQLIASLVLMAISSCAVVAFASWIYPRNILRTGAAVSWKKALTAKN